MSRAKNDQTFPRDSRLETDENFTSLIASTLRSEYGGMNSAVKELARDIGVFPRTARNWYDGKNLISSRHLLVLAQHSDAVRNLLIDLVTPETDHEYDKTLPRDTFPPRTSLRNDAGTIQNVPINVPINPFPDKLNRRQQWFVDRIYRNIRTTADHIATTWNVAPKTAKRDIRTLIELSIIERVGSRKIGRYAIIGFDNAQPLDHDANAIHQVPVL